MTLKLVMMHCLCKYYKGYSNYDPGLTLTYFTPRSNLVTLVFVWKKKWNYFLETIAVFGLRVAWSIQLNEFMKLSIKGLGLSLTLVKDHSDFKVETCFYAPQLRRCWGVILVWAYSSVCPSIHLSVRNTFWKLRNSRTPYARILKFYIWHIHEK